MEKEEDNKVTYSYESLWKAIIRPPRCRYSNEELINVHFTYKNKTYWRKDYDIINKNGQFLKCSLLEPHKENRENDIMPVVIYLHGNSSSRLEGLKMAPVLLKWNINVFLFDFSGSGMSEGEYISLGWHEKDDLKVVVDFVEKLPGVGAIGLWGRSMGAATAMIYAHTDKRIKCMVLDSPFSEFRLLAKQICSNFKGIPHWLVDFAFLFWKKTVYNVNGLDIDKLKPLDFAKDTKIPGLFIHALSDELIPIEHSFTLYENYGGKKIINVCEGTHNSKRKKQLTEKVGEFFSSYLFNKVTESKTRSDSVLSINSV